MIAYVRNVLILLVLILPVSVYGKWMEKDYQKKWCEAEGGEMEYVLDDDARVDCLTEHYACEFDFDYKWAEAVGQSLYYAYKTGRKPCVVLIGNNHKFLKRLITVALRNQMVIYVMMRRDDEPR